MKIIKYKKYKRKQYKIPFFKIRVLPQFKNNNLAPVLVKNKWFVDIRTVKT